MVKRHRYKDCRLTELPKIIVGYTFDESDILHRLLVFDYNMCREEDFIVDLRRRLKEASESKPNMYFPSVLYDDYVAHLRQYHYPIYLYMMAITEGVSYNQYRSVIRLLSKELKKEKYYV